MISPSYEVNPKSPGAPISASANAYSRIVRNCCPPRTLMYDFLIVHHSTTVRQSYSRCCLLQSASERDEQHEIKTFKFSLFISFSTSSLIQDVHPSMAVLSTHFQYLLTYVFRPRSQTSSRSHPSNSTSAVVMKSKTRSTRNTQTKYSFPLPSQVPH